MCFKLGLDISGEVVSLEEDEGITIGNIVKKLSGSKIRKKNMLINFIGCIFYFDFVIFYFCLTLRTLKSVSFTLLDKINELYMYNWRVVVHGLIVKS